MPDISAGRRQAPSQLLLVRHGESVGNVADRLAQARGASHLDLSTRDADTPLSDIGAAQAAAVGRWAAGLGADHTPHVALTSPYARACMTARAAIEHVPDVALFVDERLRERDLGRFDGMTGAGIRAAFPDEAERRGKIGKFYYRPPGGESWTDVVLRVRSILADIRAEYDGCRVWVFSHQAVLMSFRYVLESLDEATLLRIDASTPMANCAVTTYERNAAGALELCSYADTSPIDASAAPATHEASHASGAETP